MSTRTNTASITSEILFGGESNKYYADPRSRQIQTYVTANRHGEFFATLTPGRTVDYAGSQVAPYSDKMPIAYSPTFTVVDDANEWAAKASAWAVANYTGQFGAPTFPLAKADHTVCPECDHFDTLTTKQEAWSDDTTCTTEGCAYKSIYMIGD
jgi:hypothetical protein